MINLQPSVEHDATKFRWSHKLKEGFIEAAELTYNSMTQKCDRPIAGPLYMDSADIGFSLVHGSLSTTWVIKDYDRRQGDILSWTLVPTHETIREFPHLKDWQLFIIND